MVIMENIFEVFDKSNEINVYNEGVKTVYSASGKDYFDMLSCWNKMVEGAHQMPAFGVSINNYTVEEMKSGLWLEFCFGERIKVSGMDFEKLLVTVKKDYCGFNLIRYTRERGYDGRCYYIDLVDKNMADLYELLLNL